MDGEDSSVKLDPHAEQTFREFLIRYYRYTLQYAIDPGDAVAMTVQQLLGSNGTKESLTEQEEADRLDTLIPQFAPFTATRGGWIWFYQLKYYNLYPHFINLIVNLLPKLRNCGRSYQEIHHLKTQLKPCQNSRDVRVAMLENLGNISKA